MLYIGIPFFHASYLITTSFSLFKWSSVILLICFNVHGADSDTFVFVSGLKMLKKCPLNWWFVRLASNDSTLPSCVAVCPEVTIRNSIVTGEISCPHTSLQTLSWKANNMKTSHFIKFHATLNHKPYFISVMCALSQGLTWWKHLVWPRELTHQWKAWQPSLLSSTSSPPILCTETSNWRRAPSETLFYCF